MPTQGLTNALDQPFSIPMAGSPMELSTRTTSILLHGIRPVSQH